ncbi:MAG: Ig-like domain-containing protein, partial [Limisphaerales bacterium]
MGIAILFATAPSGRAQSAPTLASVSPTNGAMLVPTTASVVFVFDQEMDTSVFLLQTIPNALVGNFEVVAPGFNQSLIATWGSDKKSLTLKPAIQFPYATFTWRLNPPGALFPLKSMGGVLLDTVSGTFATGVGGTVPVLVSSSPANDSIRVDPAT